MLVIEFIHACTLMDTANTFIVDERSNSSGRIYTKARCASAKQICLFLLFVLFIRVGGSPVNAYFGDTANYTAATANVMDNILVVSRTELPFNYQAMRTNVPKLG